MVRTRQCRTTSERKEARRGGRTLWIRTALRGLATAFFLLLPNLPSASRHAEADGPATREYQLKAAFLLKFMGFIEWPPHLGNEPVRHICTLGLNPFGNALEQLATLSDSPGKDTAVHQLHDPQVATQCHLLFISRSEQERLPDVFAALRNAAVVTVGDTDDFLEKGGMIKLFVEGRRIRFAINQENARRTGIRFNAQLLALSR